MTSWNQRKAGAGTWESPVESSSGLGRASQTCTDLQAGVGTVTTQLLLSSAPTVALGHGRSSWAARICPRHCRPNMGASDLGIQTGSFSFYADSRKLSELPQSRQCPHRVKGTKREDSFHVFHELL